MLMLRDLRQITAGKKAILSLELFLIKDEKENTQKTNKLRIKLEEVAHVGAGTEDYFC